MPRHPRRAAPTSTDPRPAVRELFEPQRTDAMAVAIFTADRAVGSAIGGEPLAAMHVNPTFTRVAIRAR
jgi:hypothetical protein